MRMSNIAKGPNRSTLVMLAYADEDGHKLFKPWKPLLVDL